MPQLTTEQTKQALKSCVNCNCGECPMPEGRGCAIQLYSQALNIIERQEAEYNELWELLQTYKGESYGKQNL